MLKIIAYAVTIFLFLGSSVMGVSGCAETKQRSPSQEVEAFFVAGKEAQYLGLQGLTSGYGDLSAYSHLMKANYPHTSQVDILRKPPSRRYQAFAELEYDPASPVKPEEEAAGLKDKAREIGADAIILGPFGPDQGLPRISSRGKLPAVAIKYLDE
jgi:hypothetical protein